MLWLNTAVAFELLVGWHPPHRRRSKFVCVDAARYGYIADGEDVTIRISENVGSDFVRNVITILCEKRSALVTEMGGAAVYGDLTYAG